MSVGHSTPVSTALYVSTVEIGLARDSGKTVGPIKLTTKNGESLRDIQATLRMGERYREVFDPPLVIEPDDHISVSACSRSRFRKRSDIIIDIDLRDVECMRDDHHDGIKSYRKKSRNVEVVVVAYQRAPQASGLVSQVSGLVSPASGELVATTTELMHTCAKFRILIIGNSGVGKSALVRKIFGVEEVHASNIVRGTARIDNEFISQTNERFVVHDSLGFEAGDERHMEIVKKFVTQRQARSRLEDQLHAIWLCVDIPYSGGRLAEAGVEQFLRRQRDIIGDVPLVVVLTKVDLLDIQLELDAPGNKDPKSYRPRYLDEHCIGPLRKAAGHDVTPVAVSVEEGYSESLSDLIKTTRQNMARHGVDEAPRAMASIAQRVNIREKLELSITVGKRKYWRTLLKSAFFRGHTLKECLQVIHKDIITVWNFHDPHQCLMDVDLIVALLRADNLGDPSPSRPTMAPSFTSGSELARNLVAGTIASATTAVLRMTYDAYQEAKKDAKIFMAYIVDLIWVMQAIFLIAPDGHVTRETLVLILQAYEAPRRVVHRSVEGFDGEQAIHPGGRDKVLDMIEDLIWHHSISDHDLEKLRLQVRGMSQSSTL